MIPGAPNIAGYPGAELLHSKHFGCGITGIDPITSHGSDRTILRLHRQNGSSIGIINKHREENRSFIAFAGHFRKHGINVPEIFSVSGDELSYLMEDLGDTTLLKEIQKRGDEPFGENEISLYRKVIEILPEFQVRAGRSVDFSYCYQFNEFSEENIRFDLDYFHKRFLQNFYKGDIDINLLNNDFDGLVSRLLKIDRSNFLYRDFQSRNIMLNNGNFYFIDFQSGRRGALLYDIASLMYDAKACIPQETRELLADHYLEVIKNYTQINTAQYKEYFWYFAVVRILQAMGAYGYLGIVKRKSRFLESIPLALKNINFILNNRVQKDSLKYLRTIFSEIEYEKT